MGDGMEVDAPADDAPAPKEEPEMPKVVDPKSLSAHDRDCAYELLCAAPGEPRCPRRTTARGEPATPAARPAETVRRG